MTSRNLSTVTTDLITSYGKTAKNVLGACRAGNERAIGFMGQSWERALRKSRAKLKPEVHANALLAQKKLGAYYTRGAKVASASADIAISKLVELAAKGIHKVAANAVQFQTKTGVTALNSLAHAVVPSAESVATVARRIELQSWLLEKRIAGKAPGAAVRRVTPFKKARTRQTV